MLASQELEVVIGLEVHVQLATRTKLFSGVTCAFGQEPNTQVDVVSLGLPGSLPVLNQRAVELAFRAGLALGCDLHLVSRFDRKHYGYPDLPKGYQISQYEAPYCTGGGVQIHTAQWGTRFIPLTRIHMEEDAGKLVHQERGPFSEVDLNRAGTPLIEIVSEPALRSPAEAHAYLSELRRILRWCGVGDCEMQEGSLRCDANVSIRPVGESRLGTKVEIKNLNSFRGIEASLAFEIEQQSALWRAGRYAEVVQATKLWDPDAKVTQVMRTKEEEADYRYFPDPDLPPVVVSQETLDAWRAALPELPAVRAQRFIADYDFSESLAGELTGECEVADYVEALIAAGAPPRLAANWTREEALRRHGGRGHAMSEASPVAALAEIIQLVDGGEVARVVAKEVLDECLDSGLPPREFFSQRGLIQVRDAGQLEAWIAQALADNPQVVADIEGGNHKALGRLVGATMKLSAGQGDPKAINAALRTRFGIDG
ncbi:MAG: Asp-tRNA(Asn)/Glu-tRNA(Gln) amidotransferase subunit GatB [Planctomycetota bacterium]|nr:MAG: Asp-tRNA(Asn)/Glu-tRNA(Gln) amidotransferase subunit GatB [Planctomycetota bacterium]